MFFPWHPPLPIHIPFLDSSHEGLDFLAFAGRDMSVPSTLFKKRTDYCASTLILHSFLNASLYFFRIYVCIINSLFVNKNIKRKFIKPKMFKYCIRYDRSNKF